MSQQQERGESVNRRICPYCNDDFDSQGLYLHVRNTSGEGHHEAGSVPEGFDPKKAPVHNPEDDDVVQTDLRGEEDERELTEQRKLFRCLWCGDDMKGKGALSNHLTKSAGDEMHPEDASTDDEMYFTIPADENWNPMLEEDEIARIERKEQRDRMISEHLPGADSTEETETVQEAGGSDNMQAQQQSLTSAEVEQRKEEIIIPQDENKTVQVAAVLTQEPRFYNRPEVVTDMVNCSRTTFYEGRKLYDNSDGVDVESREADSSEDEPIEVGNDEAVSEGHTVQVDGEKYVPFAALEEVAHATTEAAEEIIERYR